MVKFVIVWFAGMVVASSWAVPAEPVWPGHALGRSVGCIGRAESGFQCEIPAVLIDPKFAIVTGPDLLSALTEDCVGHIMKVRRARRKLTSWKVVPLELRLGTNFHTGPQISFRVHVITRHFALLALEEPLPSAFKPIALSRRDETGSLYAVGYEVNPPPTRRGGRLYRVLSEELPNPSLNGTMFVRSPWPDANRMHSSALLFRKTESGYSFVGMTDNVVDPQQGDVNYVNLSKFHADVAYYLSLSDETIKSLTPSWNWGDD
jgi:hypothetical protein